MAEHHVSAKTYLIIWGWLAALMLVGVALSERHILPFSRGVVILTIVILSTIKAALVVLYYMHLKLDRRTLVFIALTPFVLIALAVGLLYSSKLVHL
ncbi:MAG: cytochrome C oxidase subunit IV family protein [Candidatus Omnitrophica bacterium]|nr:cytochrome C oxidase subunit IV family protein [Candidatus Omnitrophota bacterium]